MFYHFDSLSFEVLSISVFKHNKGFFQVKARNYSAMSFRTSGKGIFNVDGQEYISNTGDVLFIPAGIAYNVDYSGGDSIVVHFSNCNYNHAEFISIKNQEHIKNKFHALLKTWEKEANLNRAKSDIFDILYNIEKDKSSYFDESFVYAVQYINERYTDPSLKISDVCREIGLSESSLHRRFMTYYQQSPKDYLQGLRLRCAMELLFKGETSIKEVAYRSGFYDEKYFSRFIKQKLGKSPSTIYNQRYI